MVSIMCYQFIFHFLFIVIIETLTENEAETTNWKSQSKDEGEYWSRKVGYYLQQDCWINVTNLDHKDLIAQRTIQ